MRAPGDRPGAKVPISPGVGLWVVRLKSPLSVVDTPSIATDPHPAVDPAPGPAPGPPPDPAPSPADEGPGGGWDRRTLLAGAVALVAAACVAPGDPPAPTTTTAPPPPPPTTKAPTTTAKPTTTTAKPTTTTAKPTTTTTGPPPPVETDAELVHTARRLSFGPTPALLAELRTKGSAAWIDEQLAPASIDESAIAPYLAKYPRIDQTAAQIQSGVDPWRARYDLATASMVRAVWGRRQLFELLVDFWSNHLNVDINHDASQPHKPTEDREVIRKHALGRFSDMLLASAKSAAMLLYLDQAISRADGGRIPNENYARELLELHTVGVNGGYDEGDVKEVAHLLTGWTIADSSTGAFTFKSAWHNLGPLASGGSVLGWSPNGLTGLAAGESFLKHLARHPKTAERLAHKLAVRFIGEHVKPTDAVVAAAAQKYLANDTAIRPMVQHLLTSAEFKVAAGRKLRRPIEYVAACMRGAALQFDPARADSLVWALNNPLELMGQAPYAWPAPNGYPDANGKWASVGGMVARWNLAASVSVGFWWGAPTIDLNRILGLPAPATVGEAIDRVALAVLGEPLESTARAALLSATGLAASAPWKSTYNTRAILTYVLQAPQNQIR